MPPFDVGLSAIRASQLGLATVANNIANANTEGFHRQRVDLVDRAPGRSGGHSVGTGVEVAGLTRLRDQAAEVSLVGVRSLLAETKASLGVLNQLETALLPNEGSLTDAVSTFFDQVEQLAAQPTTVTIRDSLVASARTIVSQLQRLETRLGVIQRENGVAITQETASVNAIATNIAELNSRIRLAQNQGSDPNTLLDQRDRELGRLADAVDVSPISLLVEESPIFAAGGWLTIAERANSLTATTNADGTVSLATAAGAGPVVPLTGRLAGLLDSQAAIQAVRDSLRNWATNFVAAVDHLQATGRGLGVSTTALNSSRPIADANIPLGELDSAFPAQAGTLVLGVTDLATGRRRLHEIAIDPDVDTLNDVLAGINAVPNMAAAHDATTGLVRIRSLDGNPIDFAGGTDIDPTSLAWTGSSIPAVRGFPGVAGNARWTATVVGSGQIGTTPGLRLEVTDALSGAIVNTIDLGPAVVPGDPRPIAAGVSIAFPAGTVNDGETFDIRLAGEPDSTGLLTMLGIGTMFSGDPRTGLSVHPAVLADSRNVAASRTGAPGDSGNMARLIALREDRFLTNGQETIEDRLTGITTALAFRIHSEQSGLAYLEGQQLELENRQAAVSGVDPNEELVLMLEFQRAFQAASRFVAAVDETLDELFRLVG